MKILIVILSFCSCVVNAKSTALLGDQTYPESLALRPSTSSLYVGSAGDGSVQEIHSDGRVDYFLAAGADGRSETYGVKIDDERGRLWLVDGQAVYIYDLASHSLLKKIARQDLGAVKDSFLNDIALDLQGNAYVTDSRRPELLRVAVDWQTELIALDIPITESNGIKYNLNGIVFAPDYSYLVSVKTNDGTLWKIALGPGIASVVQIPLSQPVSHGDGLTWSPDGQLVVFRNYEDKVSAIDLRSPAASKPVTDLNIQGLKTPTSGVFVERQLVIVNSQFANDTPVLPFELLQVDF